MNANGEHSEFALDIPPDVDPQTRTMVEGMSPQLAKISVPFPSEPVGTGARWITHTSTELNGIHTDVATTYTLRERTGDQYRVGVSYEQSAPQQDIDLPGMPPGIDTQVTGVAIAGSGETAGSLTMLFPLTSTAKATGTVDMRVDDGQGTEDMHQNLDMSVNVESIPT